MEENKDIYFEVVKEFADKWNHIDDYEIFDSFDDYNSALASERAGSYPRTANFSLRGRK